MQTRVLVSLAGGLLGFALAPEISAKLSLDLPLALSFAGFATAGWAIGYVASVLFDVFAGHSDANQTHSQN